VYNFEHNVILWIIGAVLGGFFLGKAMIGFLSFIITKFEVDDPNDH